mmetsp:Transcript_24797/g.40112  ORF Transcript_24797/g.40112 Transcript_24797/m.40112 type:complete len:202 (-) Transcript_24797:625-1230(-)
MVGWTGAVCGNPIWRLIIRQQLIVHVLRLGRHFFLFQLVHVLLVSLIHNRGNRVLLRRRQLFMIAIAIVRDMLGCVFMRAGIFMLSFVFILKQKTLMFIVDAFDISLFAVVCMRVIVDSAGRIYFRCTQIFHRCTSVLLVVVSVISVRRCIGAIVRRWVRCRMLMIMWMRMRVRIVTIWMWMCVCMIGIRRIAGIARRRRH